MSDEKTKLAVPTVHLNGTSKDRLMEALTNASQSVWNAMDELCSAAPNARDYYVQSNEAFSKAQSEHDSRIERMRSVHTELNEIAWAILEQCK